VIDLLFDVALVQGEFAIELRESSNVEVLGLFGPSGSGKTTLLEIVAGLRTPARGTIRVGDATLFDSAQGIDKPPRDRGIGYVPQDVLLFPHLDVRGNLLYGARAAALDPLIEILDIRGLLDRRVSHLSGGERQRVAIGRALMTSPALLLLDEPLAAVDRQRREQILPYLLRVRRELHVPLVYVTHDAIELLQIADRVLVLDGGVVRAAGAPHEVLQGAADNRR
jgi:molybdate transport system ATP-binding protein